MEESIYPVGTPEHEAYVADLRAELAKFAKGKEPYPYRREEMAMATVPNWIAKGYVFVPGFTQHSDAVYPVNHWRATRTQVVVQVDGLNGEFRFYLDTLKEAGHSGTWDRKSLAAPDDSEVVKTLPEMTKRTAVADLKKALTEPLDASAMDAEALVVAIGRIQRAATKALADLADLL